MDLWILLLDLMIGLVLGAIAGIAVHDNRQRARGRGHLAAAEAAARTVAEEAQAQARRVVLAAEERARQHTDEADAHIRRRQRDLDREEERLARRRDEQDALRERHDAREQQLNKRQSRQDKQQSELDQAEAVRAEALQKVAQMSVEEARAALMASVERDARHDMARLMRQIEAEARDTADARARDVIALAVQRLASEHVSEIAVSVVTLPSDEMKGRIIGRNGRNIRAFELATGVDVIVDDTPEAVTISSFDPVRREVAKRAMAKLVVDGRIHPARIEKLVDDARAEVEQVVREEGERAAYETGVPGLHPEILKLVGRLKFRSSYGQNMHAHAIETAHIAGIIAAELGADVALAKAGGLLHDIGKAIDHEVEGTHALLGADFVRRHGGHPYVVNCIAAHHQEVEQVCVEATIVEAADAISGARPGARRESLDAYIKRVRMLEEIASSFDGVVQSYALQAGREVRILVRPEDVDDYAAQRLSRDIARKIEETMQYPGQIKVQVIRETRAVEFAK